MSCGAFGGHSDTNNNFFSWVFGLHVVCRKYDLVRKLLR